MSEITLTNTSLRQTKPRLKRTPRVHLPFFIPISLLPGFTLNNTDISVSQRGNCTCTSNGFIL